MRTIFLIIGLVGLIGCGGPGEAEQTPGEESISTGILVSQAQFESAQMALDTLRRRAFSHTLSTTGIIDVPPENKVSVSTYYGGYIKGLKLLPGEYVRKGQVLFRLENPEFVQMQQDYWEAHSQLDYLQSDFERQQTLAQEQINSQKQFLKAESDYKSTLARYQGLKKKLQLIHLPVDSLAGGSWRSWIPIYAPISGYITQIPITQGKFLASSELALEITSTQHLHLELDIFEKDLPFLQKGQKLTFYVPEQPETVYGAHIYLIGKNIDSEKRTVRVHAHLDHEGQDGQFFIPGMYVEARIATQSREGWALPEEAIVSLEETSYALLQTQHVNDQFQFEQIPLQTGETQSGWTEILTPTPELQKGRFLVQGAFSLIQE